MRTVDKIYLVDQENELEEESSKDGKCEKVFRKPPKILKWMIYSIISLMIAILITSVLSTMALHIINSNFDWFNIFTAEIKFEPKPFNEITNEVYKKINSSHFEVKSLKDSVSKFVYEDDRLVNPEDLKYLIKMQVDKSKTLWGDETLSTYLLKYPEVSEAISIIWLMMTVIYQCGHRDANWGIPEGWRIVVPSILVFFVMSILTIIVSVLGKRAMTHFCTELKKELIEPDLVRCGLAIAHLRLQRQSHAFIFDRILNLYLHMNYAKAFCWSLSFVIMFLRFLFAIDFQLIELRMLRYETTNTAESLPNTGSLEPFRNDVEYLKSSIVYEVDENEANKVRKSNDTIKDENNENKSDGQQQRNLKANYYEEDEEIEDFQSASSILMRTPLMASGDHVDAVP